MTISFVIQKKKQISEIILLKKIKILASQKIVTQCWFKNNEIIKKKRIECFTQKKIYNFSRIFKPLTRKLDNSLTATNFIFSTHSCRSPSQTDLLKNSLAVSEQVVSAPQELCTTKLRINWVKQRCRYNNFKLWMLDFCLQTRRRDHLSASESRRRASYCIRARMMNGQKQISLSLRARKS